MANNAFVRIPEGPRDLRDALFQSYMMARRGKRSTEDEYKFEVFTFENLEQLARDIEERRYKPSRGKAFITHNPVTREIFAAPFRDRVVHHFLYAANGYWWDKHFIYDSYSCRDNKGTDFGIRRLQKFMRQVSQNGTRRAFVVKADVSGYFMSLKRDLLYEEILWGLSKQFPNGGWLYETCKYLWREIIFDDPTRDVRLAGKWSYWDPLPCNKSLFFQPEGQGIVIGNLTSQLLSNIHLNRFDRFMKIDMGYAHYGRYVDDFFVVLPEEELHDYLYNLDTIIRTFLNEIGQTLHPDKTTVIDVRKGVPYLGRMVHLYNISAGKRIRTNFYKVAREYMMGYKMDEAVQSYVGMGFTGLNERVFESVGW